MLMVNVYRWRDDAHGKDAALRIMEAYGHVGEDAGTIAHYVFTDGTGGVVIVDTDDTAAAYRGSLYLSEFLDLQATRSHPAVTLDQALGAVGEYLGG